MVLYRQLILRRDGHELLTSTLAGDRYAIGRHGDNTLPLPDDAASDFHAEIRIDGGQAVLTDLGSASGTFVGGTRLNPHEPFALNDGDVIGIGPYELVYRSPIDQSGDAEVQEGDPVPVAAVEDLEPLTIPPIPPRRVDEVLPPPGSTASRYLQFLPLAFQKSDENGHRKDPNDFLSRFLQIFETIWEPLEQRQDHIAMFFSPRTCPASWTPWLASWLGLSLDPLMSEARARAVIMNTMWIYQRRGTRAALVRAIEVHLGLRPEIIERADEPNVFRVRVKLPKDSAADLLPALRELVLSEKPAHMGFVIEVKP